MSRKHATHPHPGRSYTAASGAFVRVDYVKPSGTVQCEIWPARWESKGSSRTTMLAAADFVAMAEEHGLQPVQHKGGPSHG